MSGKIEAIAFNGKIAEYGDILHSEQRVIISGKVNRRSDDEPPSIIVETVKTVDNSNIFTVELKDDFKFEELVLLKNVLCEYQGADPVMLKVKDDYGMSKILAASMFWVNSSNDLVNRLHKAFNDRVVVDIKSMDTPEEKLQIA